MRSDVIYVEFPSSTQPVAFLKKKSICQYWQGAVSRIDNIFIRELTQVNCWLV